MARKKIKKLSIDPLVLSYLLFISGALIVLAGGMLNIFVMMRNDGRMPVYTENINYESSKHFTYDNPNKINEPKLSDIFNISGHIFSLGDFIMLLGVAMMVYGIVMIVFNTFIIMKKEKNQDNKEDYESEQVKNKKAKTYGDPVVELID